MKVFDLPLKGLKKIIPRVFEDSRGFFFESYQTSRYQEEGITVPFVQDNCAFSQKNTLRGLHFQSEPGQDKLISVSHGKIFDVAVDIRKNSKTFGKYHALILDAEKKEQFFVPKGFAHGYLVLSETALIHYKVSAIFNPKTEKEIRYDDPAFGIEWPVKDPILSERDQKAPFFEEVACLSGC